MGTILTQNRDVYIELNFSRECELCVSVTFSSVIYTFYFQGIKEQGIKNANMTLLRIWHNFSRIYYYSDTSISELKRNSY